MNFTPLTPENATFLAGKTFACKEQLKLLGAQWDFTLRGWWIPKNQYDAARAIVDNMEGQLRFEF